MEISLSLVEFKNDQAVLRSEQGFDVVWPQKNLPKDVKIGDKLNFLISLNSIDLEKRKQSAKDILNELLG
ncbi:MAG: hypothetical protein WC928_01160 [Patescibacteria group bacterium]|jgi:hypothetical protein